ncbi:cytochrome c oxidase assembly protein [Variovorax sp. UMC13]|uniref:cytochrome c oxidase assembly protein n=1 Tax=Variovorax sp. UMC13 TaxID=1862326 RepID=UPI00217F9460|nr:cytochrome c oxidase assembly protein [Variovorax sp. UMC13]MBB1600437.1 cytochrome C oxidase assembly protein [Variovorax sp. UMC13]
MQTPVFVLRRRLLHGATRRVAYAVRLTMSGAALTLSGIACAHVIDPSASPAAWLQWSLDPFVLCVLAIGLVLYALGYRQLRSRSHARSRVQRERQGMAFAGGWVLLLIALVSPLDGLGAALFSAHMVQHELLMIVAAPLLVLGRPLGIWVWALPSSWRKSVGGVVRWPPLRAVWKGATAPAGAWLLHAAALWLWHIPVLFQSALLHPWVHTLQHTSFLGSALLFWWTIFRHPGGAAMLSLFTTMVHTGALGALLTLAPGLWYPLYVESSAALGFDALQDQQMGGLVMWVPGGIAYLASALVIAARWLDDRRSAAALSAPEAP